MGKTYQFDGTYKEKKYSVTFEFKKAYEGTYKDKDVGNFTASGIYASIKLGVAGNAVAEFDRFSVIQVVGRFKDGTMVMPDENNVIRRQRAGGDDAKAASRGYYVDQYQKAAFTPFYPDCKTVGASALSVDAAGILNGAGIAPPNYNQLRLYTTLVGRIKGTRNDWVALGTVLWGFDYEAKTQKATFIEPSVMATPQLVIDATNRFNNLLTDPLLKERAPTVILPSK